MDAQTIVHDSMEQFLIQKGFNEKERITFLEEVGGVTMENMFVTPKNIDESVKRISFTISEALNQCFG